MQFETSSSSLWVKIIERPNDKNKITRIYVCKGMGVERIKKREPNPLYSEVPFGLSWPTQRLD